MTLFERIQLVSTGAALYGFVVYQLDKHFSHMPRGIGDVVMVILLSLPIYFGSIFVLFLFSELLCWVATGTGY